MQSTGVMFASSADERETKNVLSSEVIEQLKSTHSAEWNDILSNYLESSVFQREYSNSPQTALKMIDDILYAKNHPIDLSGTEIDGIDIVPFDISHDCAQGFGYSIFLENNIKISVCSSISLITYLLSVLIELS